MEKKATGRYPDPEELARRIKPRWKRDIDHIAELIERTRPAEPEKDKTRTP